MSFHAGISWWAFIEVWSIASFLGSPGLFWLVSILPLTCNSSNSISKPLRTVPRGPITIVTFMFHRFSALLQGSSISLSFRILFFFFHSVTAKSTRWQVLIFLPIKTRSGLLGGFIIIIIIVSWVFNFYRLIDCSVLLTSPNWNALTWPSWLS